MAKIDNGLYFIQGQDDFIPDSHTYIIGDPSSMDLSIIDVGLTGKGRYKMQSIIKDGIKPEAIKRVIMTHTHMDHIGCLAEILKEIPHAELWVHRLEGELLEKGDDRAVYGMDMFKGMCEMQYGLKPDAFKFNVHRMLEGGEKLNIGNMEWEIIHIPGHSLGGIALYHREKKILIPGDVIYADYAIGRFDLFGANGAELKKSLIKLSEFEVDMLLPGHNQLVKGLPSDYIAQTARMWAPYLE
ncbi:MAG TPA: MBL fold metallo-hydrolase [Syntrophorhabdaceae bacterium]|nr:MBL fold metallo-hydrolase [Syntrophorhabdaceae bacterium]